MTGRPSIRTNEIDNEICRRLSEGEPLAWICRDEGMPSTVTVWEWQQKDENLSERIAHAREIGGDAIAADALAIADENSKDTIRRPDGSEGPDSEWISRSRLRVETRLKLLAKWHPKRYGDRLDVTSGGEPLKPADTNEQSARLAAILAAAEGRSKQEVGE